MPGHFNIKLKFHLLKLSLCLVIFSHPFRSSAHDIYFCGEKIPLEDDFVKNKLMNIIKSQIKFVNLQWLRDSVNKYMPAVKRYLQSYNLPEDFQYLAIVESSFKSHAESRVGAKGFWQLMKVTAKDWNMIVTDEIDERTDFEKSTDVACKELRRNYRTIQLLCHINSWVLTAAAYNHGSGSMVRNVRNQGNNYFKMELNAETAAYVYKIIAIKELFEYPELYMNNFGYNLFSTAKIPDKLIQDNNNTGTGSFSKMNVYLQNKDDVHPADLANTNTNIQKALLKNQATQKYKYITARVTEKYKKLKDGDIVTFEVDDDLAIGTSRWIRKGSPLRGTAWIIGDRVQVDLDKGHAVILYDINSIKGIQVDELRKKKPTVLLKVELPK
jgi:hypothetical protein